MFRWLRNQKGQSTAEYAIVIGLIIAATVAMQSYVKRGLQGRVKEAVEHVGAAGDVGGTTLTFSGKQFEPTYVGSDFTAIRSHTATETVSTGGGVKRDVTDDETSRTGEQTVGYEEEE